MSVAAVAFLTPLDMTHSTQVFDIALSPVTHIVELGKIASATAGQFSVPSAVAHPNNNPVMRYAVATPPRSTGLYANIAKVLRFAHDAFLQRGR